MVASIILWSRVQVPAGPPDKKTNPSSGWSFFCLLPRAGAGPCGFLWTSRFPGGARIWPFSLSPGHSSLRPRCPLEAEVHEFIELHCYESTAYRWSVKRLIGGIGRRWKQQRYCSERTTLKVLLLSDLVLVCYRAWAHPVGEVAHRPLLRLAGCRIWMSANSSHVPPMETHRTRTRLLL